jgi:riboflavin synthase
MFTGIITEIGEVVGLEPLTIRAPRSVRSLAPGGSLSVNGACLTVTRIEADTMSAEVVDETRRRTNLGHLQQGDRVNLELPLRAGSALDGHLVQGHVDGTARVTAATEVRLGREVTFELPEELEDYVAEKGSIAVDGASLTVAGLGEGSFTVALIPHTLRETIASGYATGTVVNLEVDIVARYLERLVRRGIGKG